MRRHRVIKVELGNETFLADAGLGSLCPVTPLSLEFNVVQKKNFRSYQIVKDPMFGTVVQAETPEGFLPYFSFTDDPHFPQDFLYAHAYCVQQPDSVFRNKLFVHKITENKQWIIENPTPESPEFALRINGETETERIVLRSKTEMQNVLADIFGLHYPPESLPEFQ